MGQLYDIVVHISTLLIIGLVAFIMLGLGYVGERLWAFRKLRRTLVIMDSIKFVLPPLIGFWLAWIPQIPLPGPLEGHHRLLFAFVGLLAGALWREMFMLVKSQAKARGIDLEIDLPPKVQRHAEPPNKPTPRGK